MTGEFYLLNALWVGAALYLIGRFLPHILRLIRYLLPHGLVVAFDYSSDVIKVTNALRNEDGIAGEDKPAKK